MAAVMLKHKKSKKLNLSTETVRSLADHDLVAVDGGQADTINDCQILTVTRFPFCQPSIPVLLCATSKPPVC
jgi:hypothetical protein